MKTFLIFMLGMAVGAVEAFLFLSGYDLVVLACEILFREGD